MAMRYTTIVCEPVTVGHSSGMMHDTSDMLVRWREVHACQ